jgi:hypothetical protein
MSFPFAAAGALRLEKRSPRITLALVGFVMFNASCVPQFPPAGKLTPLKLDEPKEAALTFVRAIGAGDPETAKAASLGTDRQKRWAVSTAIMVSGLRAFDAAITARFGPAAAGTHMSILNGLSSVTIEPEEAVKNADVQMSLDEQTARLVLKSTIYTAHMYYASRVRKTAQGWKVDLPAIFAANPQFMMKNESPDLDQLVSIGNAMRSLAKEIRAGKYDTIDAAEAAAKAATSDISPKD